MKQSQTTMPSENKSPNKEKIHLDKELQKNFNSERDQLAFAVSWKRAVSHLYKDFNYGRHEMEQIMPYCRISV